MKTTIAKHHNHLIQYIYLCAILLCPLLVRGQETVSLTASSYNRCVNETVTLTVQVTPAEWQSCVEVELWDYAGYITTVACDYCNNYTASYTTYTRGTSGLYMVGAFSDNACDIKYVTFVRVSGISLDRAYACDNGTVTCTAVIDPPGFTFPDDHPSWSATVGTLSATTGSSVIWTAPSSFSGSATITASSCGADQTASISAIGLSVSGPSSVVEGLDTTDYIATVTPNTLSDVTYSWSDNHPANIGNDAPPSFSAQTSATTKLLQAHWFSWDNKRTFENLAECDRQRSCTNKIQCTISYGGGTKTVGIDLVITVQLDAITYPPSMTGFPATISYTENGNYHIIVDRPWSAGQGTLARTPVVISPGTMPTTSQFYNKVITVHEMRHANQWNTLSPCNALHQPYSFYINSGILDFDDILQNDINIKIANRLRWWNETDAAYAWTDAGDIPLVGGGTYTMPSIVREWRQLDALDQSDGETPHYFEENHLPGSAIYPYLPPLPPGR